MATEWESTLVREVWQSETVPGSSFATVIGAGVTVAALDELIAAAVAEVPVVLILQDGEPIPDGYIGLIGRVSA